MPLPTNIDALLASADGFNPSATRKAYEDMAPVWRGYLDLYELDVLRLSEMVEAHADEDPDKLKLRRAAAAVYNLVPTIINLSRNYLFSDAPVIKAKADSQLQTFIDDCDGNGTPLADFVKSTALPVSLVCGFVDAVVCHPNTSGEELRTAADVAAARLKPHVVAYTPMDRVNWSCSPDGGYNWARYRDVGDEGQNPFKQPVDTEAFVTLAVQDGRKLPAYWVRSVNNADGGNVTATWDHDGDLCPTLRAPIATLFYQRSIDRQRRRDAISKIAIIAILTKQIVQILSWTTEDVLANLAILALPTKSGKEPTKEDGSPAITSLGVFSKLCYPADSKNPPMFVQGEVTHIDVKLKLVELHLREIMRLANLMAVAGDVKATTSGVQAVVERNELFRELKDLSASLDAFTLDVLSLAASWISNKNVTPADLNGKVEVKYFKGPFTVEPLADVIKNTEAALSLFRGLSPTAAEAMLKQVVRAGVDDADLRDKAIGELDGAGEAPPPPPVVEVLPGSEPLAAEAETPEA